MRRMALSRLREIPWEALQADVALPAIARVLAGGAAEREVDRALRAHRELSAAGRTAAVEAIFGVALWRRRLAWHAGLDDAPYYRGAPQPLPSRIVSGGSDIAGPELAGLHVPGPDAAAPDVPAALLTSLLRDLAGLPESRALALTGLRAAPASCPAPTRLAHLWSLPDWLESHLERELGAHAGSFCAAIAVPGPVCLRANRLLCTRDELAARLALEGIATRPGTRSPDALVVETKNANLFGSRAWRDGLFEPQDEGSQLLGHLVEAEPGETVLDLCAGAGGKSLLLAAQGATVFAHDPDDARLDRLRTRAARARATRIEIVSAPVRADRVLVDAPCSELGTLRRGPDARWRIDPSALTDHVPLQRELLETAARCAKRRIVYATCTVNRAENEEVAAHFDEAHAEFRRVHELRLLPHTDGTDGFFAAAWDRTT